MLMHTMGVGHVMQHDAGHVCDETPGVSPGLGGHRDGFGTEYRTSHNRYLNIEREHMKVYKENKTGANGILAGWLVYWPVSRYIGRLVSILAGWSVYWLMERYQPVSVLASQCIGQLVYWPVSVLAGWGIGWLVWK